MNVVLVFFFFFNDTATTEIYTLSLHDALPISRQPDRSTVAGSSWTLRTWTPRLGNSSRPASTTFTSMTLSTTDRKSTRLNSSHANISYAVFCLKKKKHYKIKTIITMRYTVHCI